MYNHLMKDLWMHLKETNKPVALYGTGNGADKIIDKMIEDGSFEKIKAVFASDGFVRKRTFRGFEVECYSDVKARLGDMIVLMCFGSSRPEVLENVIRISGENEFYAPDVPVYGKEVFDSGYYEKNKALIEEASAMMEDDISKLTFDCTVNYKISGDISYLTKCEVSKEDADRLLSLPDDSTMIDLGAYIGDTVLWYTSLFPQIKHIIAVEPNPKTFKKLESNTADFDIQPVNALISDTSGFATSDGGTGRGFHKVQATESADNSIKTVTIDELSAGKKIDFIKFDVEGSELDAINGGINTIKKYHPSMQIACYHRSDDIFAIPNLIKSIDPTYKVYMRHLPYVPGWDTQFYFI